MENRFYARRYSMIQFANTKEMVRSYLYVHARQVIHQGFGFWQNSASFISWKMNDSVTCHNM